MTGKSALALVIIGYDGYEDVWEHYFELLDRFWPDNPYPVYLVNQEKRPSYKNVTVINCGADAEWSRKAQTAVEQIEADYICLLLEDFLAGQRIQTKEVEDTLEWIIKEQIRYYKLFTFSKIRTPHYKGISYLRTIPENMDYGISLQASIWERTFLKETLGTQNYNAWVFEADRLEESQNASSNLAMQGCVYDSRNILQIQHGIVQSKYLPNTVKYFERIGYPLNTKTREIMRGKNYRLYRLKKAAGNLPPSMKPMVKKVMKLFGMKFVSDQGK